jgi:hypothetical protein
MTPAERVGAACAANGEAAVAIWCAGVLEGSDWNDHLDWIADTAAHTPEWLAKEVNHYWPRVWAARALLYAWHPDAAPAVVAALADEAWRVREMSAKVAGRRKLADAADPLSDLDSDPVERVRVAALRALDALDAAGPQGASA